MTEVLVTGTFNIMHAGHVELFEFASKLGKVTVGLNADAYLHGKYGEDKTVPLVSRAYVVSSCKFVDRVVVFTDNDPSSLILDLQPRFFVRGPDYSGVELPEQDALDQIGAQVVIHCADKIHDSSTLVHAAGPGAFQPNAAGDIRSWHTI